MRPIRTLSATVASIPSPAAMQTRSPWHSPVPYLFGGLAAMLGLIAFALLILACSYWRLSGRLDSGGDDEDLENGSEKDSKLDGKGKVYEEKILVIMAGDQTPTFLATPVSSRVSVLKIENREEEEKMECGEKKKEEFQNDDGEASEREEPMS
ncbi:protein GLUTAMINE DUMPER 5-like [Euphorbia lathyris]|uniref:protein GLUTAMINE DUMPER 5-like n=1 Tax=Euphorbia lathyris TaxID=212925 RepID=UPI003313554E